MKPQRSFLALAVVATFAQAQVAPDAGQTLRQQEQQQPIQPTKPSAAIVIPATPTQAPAPGGATVKLETVVFHGATKLSDAALQAVVHGAIGQALDMAGLWGLAQRVSEAYRAAGYPFARAYLPPQQLQDGTLRIEIVEGRYGRVRATGDAALAASAQSFLKPLVPGEVIESAPLERTTLVLGDLPGIVVTPVMRPGEQAGTGDLDVEVRRGPRVRGSLSLDNEGNRYTGPTRLQADASSASALVFGDQVAVHAMATDAKLWFGSLGYSLPVGSAGLRGHGEFARTYYQLGGEFTSLDASGTANVATLGLSWPIVRSQAANLSLDVSATHKSMRDAQGAAGTSQAKSSNALPIALSFDERDGLLGGGLSYGAFTVTPGHLDLGATLAVTDASTARTAGAFTRVNLDVARMQALGPAVTLFGRVAAQWASKNLDSSEGFGPGGVTGVRAFPGGEAYGNEGWVAQMELRRSGGELRPYAFYDIGGSRANVHPWTAGRNDRVLSGLGVGVRAQVGRWSLDASAAHPTHGTPVTSESNAPGTRVWAAASVAF
ncbi:MAG TPA: ShlB/FhaC/HecB family hemolysin secretion/activation protein [Burkholderiaceae bacterium]